MTNKTIENIRKAGSDSFYLKFKRRYNKNLQFYLDQFNPDDYWIFKLTGKQKLVSKEDLYEFKYAGYIFFKKDIYDPNDILLFCDLIRPIYLIKPVPPKLILDRIKIIV